MSTYESLDNIADAYTPILFIAYLIMSVVYWRQGDKLASLKGFSGIAIAYAFMFADNAIHAWPSVGLDYSTHSAVALALIVFHVHKKALLSLTAIGIMVSLVAYYALEVYQKYHSVADILSTAAVVGIAIFAAYRLIAQYHRKRLN